MIVKNVLRAVTSQNFRKSPVRALSAVQNLNNVAEKRTSKTSQIPSYVHCVSSEPLVHCTVSQLLRNACELTPDREAFIFPAQNIRVTYAKLLADAEQLASSLVSVCDVQMGDRIAIWAPNTYEWLLTQYAAAFCGAVLVNVNPGNLDSELRYVLNKVGAKVLIMSPSYRQNNFYEIAVAAVHSLPNSRPGSLHDSNVPKLKHVLVTGLNQADSAPPGTWNYEQVLHAGDSRSKKLSARMERATHPDHPANIQFTSGTTGQPKGATLSHHNIVNNARLIGIRTGYDKFRTIVCCPPPLYHCFGCVIGSLSTVAHNATTVFPALSFEPLAALQAVEAEGCTSLYGTPTMFIDMLNHPRSGEFKMDTLRTGIMAGAPCPVELCNRLITEMHMKDFTGLGVAPGADESDAITLPVGSVGELYVRGYSVMLGYWGDEEKSREAVGRDGWFRTGDMAIMHPKTLQVSIVGRSKELIIRGGENVYPAEIEQILFQHPDIEDAHVLGVPDMRLGEEICVWVRAHRGSKLTQEQLKLWCRDRMARFKVPKYVLFKSESDFPMTVTGKVQKFRMREMSIEQLQLQHVEPHLSFDQA